MLETGSDVVSAVSSLSCMTIPLPMYKPLKELPIPVRSLSSTVEVLIPTDVFVDIPAVPDINLPADTPVETDHHHEHLSH